MPKLYLHIGVEKTGTTSIQSFLAMNRACLEECGFHVPLCCRADNHVEFALACYRDCWSDELTALWGLSDQAECRRAQIEEWTEVLAAELKSTSAESWIVSSEALHSRFVHQEDIRRLADFLRHFFEDVFVVIYLREPLQLALSLWSTGVKCGNVIPQLPSPDEPYIANACCHASTMERWRSVFAPNVVIRLFDQERFAGASLFHDFCGACGIPWNNNFNLPPRENKCLTGNALKVLNAINQAIPLHLTDGSINYARADLTYFIESQNFGDFPYQPTAMEIQSYRKAFADSNEIVRRSYFPHLTSLFPERYQELSSMVLREPASQSMSISESVISDQRDDFTTIEQALIDAIVKIWEDKVMPPMSSQLLEEKDVNRLQDIDAMQQDPPEDRVLVKASHLRARFEWLGVIPRLISRLGALYSQ